MEPVLRNPVDLGFDGEAVEAAWIGLVRGADRHEYGGAVALVARGGQVALCRATGWAVREPDDQRSPMGVDTIFDLASLTKVTATTPAILQLVAAGRLGLEGPVGEVLPEFGTEGMKAGVTIRRLLTHSAGFQGGFPPLGEARGIPDYLESFARTQPEWEPDTRVTYTDQSFIVLGAVVQRVTGEPIDVFATREVFEPLGMTDTMFTPSPHLRSRIAATELRPCPAIAPSVRRQYDLIWGRVHDRHAWYGFAGIAGHAGLFGTAMDLFRYGQMWLNGGELDGVRILPEDLVAEAAVNHTRYRTSSEARGYGWRMRSRAAAMETAADASRGMSPWAFGHTGFTGTSMWVDPESDLITVVLTNAVHPTVNSDYLETRARFNAAIVAAIRE